MAGRDWNAGNLKVIEQSRANNGQVDRPLLLLNTIGAKSGQHRTNPLTYTRDCGGSENICTRVVRGEVALVAKGDLLPHLGTQLHAWATPEEQGGRLLSGSSMSPFPSKRRTGFPQ